MPRRDTLLKPSLSNFLTCKSQGDFSPYPRHAHKEAPLQQLPQPLDQILAMCPIYFSRREASHPVRRAVGLAVYLLS